MTPDEFRRHGRETLDWLASYLERIGDLPVAPRVAPGDIAALLPARAPERGEPFERLLADLDRLRAKFASKMADSADAQTFATLTQPGAVTTRAFREIARTVTSRDTLAAFPTGYPKLYPHAAPPARPPPSPG
ncbi:MAG: hypothetical protein IBJ10_03590, partial [Phycisphaerales bacterium]|nr:hypothetical protein [Phycisphaerales bacterium]